MGKGGTGGGGTKVGDGDATPNGLSSNASQNARGKTVLAGTTGNSGSGGGPLMRHPAEKLIAVPRVATSAGEMIAAPRVASSAGEMIAVPGVATPAGVHLGMLRTPNSAASPFHVKEAKETMLHGGMLEMSPASLTAMPQLVGGAHILQFAPSFLCSVLCTFCCPCISRLFFTFPLVLLAVLPRVLVALGRSPFVSFVRAPSSDGSLEKMSRKCDGSLEKMSRKCDGLLGHV
jgi:hypothetical protein